MEQYAPPFLLGLSLKDKAQRHLFHSDRAVSGSKLRAGADNYHFMSPPAVPETGKRL